MADRSDISQFIPAAGADDAAVEISQNVPLVGADDAAAEVSQFAPTVGADDARAFISQFVLLVGRGPEVVPPADSPAGTFTFDEGLGNDWFIALWPSDSGDELRAKTVKPFHITGRGANRIGKVYTYDVTESINVDAVEAGTGYKALQVIPDSATHVQQSPRLSVNVPNSAQHLIRVEGIWDGSGERPRVDEIVYEIAAKTSVRR